MQWLIHMDPDELLYPQYAKFINLASELCGAPPSTPYIRFMNVEGWPEAGGIRNRYEQVTLFRSNKHMTPPASMKFRYTLQQGNNTVSMHVCMGQDL